MKRELIAKHEKDSRACRDAFALTLKDVMAADKTVCYVDCDLMGCVMLLMGEHDAAPTESEQALAQTFAGFLGKQMES